MFGAALLVVATLLHLYVFGGAASLPRFAGRAPRRLHFAGGANLWAAFFVARAGGNGWSAAVPSWRHHPSPPHGLGARERRRPRA